MQAQDQALWQGSMLFPPLAERRGAETLLNEALENCQLRISDGPVSPTLDLTAFRRELAGFDFQNPSALDDVLRWVIASLERGLVQITHPRYFGLFNPAPAFPAQCADRVAAVFNPQLATWTTSPVAVELEAHVIRAIAMRAGLPQAATGHFTTGGAEANFTALVCALTDSHPEFAQHGVRCFSGAPAVYISRDAHLAWIKIAHQSGIGRDAVRLVATDGHGRMDPASLAEAIATDRANGGFPVLVVATAGTTNAGMIDPLKECAEVARHAKVWFHVDAAWAGALISSPRRRPVLAGIELADSITIDAHKWFATTMGCGMFITRRGCVLSAAFQVATQYMPSRDAGIDPYLTTIQWSRRFLGLRLFLSLAAAGWAGYAIHVEHALELAELAATRLRERGWTVVNQSRCAVLCIEPPPGSASAASIVRDVVDSGLAWISTTTFEGRPTIRVCITHGTTTRDDIGRLIAKLVEAAGQKS
jgi:aromatic-L-amino-acid decarboxylase